MGRKAKVELYATPGEIKEHGYHVYDSEIKRHRALIEAVKEEGHARPVFRHLIVRAIQLKNTSPRASRILREDAEWVKEKFYGTKWWPVKRR